MEEGPDKRRIETTKRIGRSGSSLTLNITKEADMLGLDRGDSVKIVMEVAEVRPKRISDEVWTYLEEMGTAKDWHDALTMTTDPTQIEAILNKIKTLEALDRSTIR